MGRGQSGTSESQEGGRGTFRADPGWSQQEERNEAGRGVSRVWAAAPHTCGVLAATGQAAGSPQDEWPTLNARCCSAAATVIWATQTTLPPWGPSGRAAWASQERGPTPREALA